MSGRTFPIQAWQWNSKSDHSQYEESTKLRGILLAFIIAAVMWIGIGWGTWALYRVLN